MNIITDNSKVNYNLVQENEALKAEIKELKEHDEFKKNTILIAAIALECILQSTREDAVWYRTVAEVAITDIVEQ